VPANYVNLMSERAQYCATARRAATAWAAVIVALLAALTPMGVYAWHERRLALAEQQTLEAQYEPIHQFGLEIRRLRTAASALVRVEHTSLELSRSQSPLTLLGIVGKAAAESAGELYVKRLTISSTPVRDRSAPALADQTGRMAIEASSSVIYDVQRFVKLLNQPPLQDVKLLSTESVAEPSGTRKRYGLEGEF